VISVNLARSHLTGYCPLLVIDELVVAVGGKGHANPALKALSPSGLVPCLQVQQGVGGDGSSALCVWETLSIVEFLHESHPTAGPLYARARVCVCVCVCLLLSPH
jgi:glutathione S-transferase